MFRILTILLLTCNLAVAQISQQTIANDIINNLPTNNQNEISAQLLRNTLNAMTSAIFQSQGLNGLTLSGIPTLGQVPVATSASTASWQTIGGTLTVANTDGSLLFNPTSGNVIGSINPAHSNTFTVPQFVPTANNNTNDTTVASTAFVRSVTYSVSSCFNAAQLADIKAGTKLLDLTSAIQTCLTAFGTNVGVTWPAGTYLISDTIIIPSGQAEFGTTVNNNQGSIIYAATGMNAPMFKFTSSGSAIGFAFLGTATAGTPLQYCNYINNTNLVTLKNNFYTNCYVGIYIDGSSFYTSILENLIYSNYAYQLQVNSVTSAGVDLIHRGNRYLAATSTQSASVKFDGLGSIISSDNQFSNNNPSGAMVLFNTIAPLWGGGQFTNDVFENGNTTINPAVSIQGSSASPWNALMFADCFFTGNGAFALLVNFSDALKIIGGNISGVGAAGALSFEAFGTVTNMSVIGTHFDGNSSNTPIQSQGSLNFNGSFTDVFWGGSAAVIDMTAASTTITHFDWIGGNPGTNATPIKLPAGSIKGVQAYNGLVSLNNGLTYFDIDGGLVQSGSNSGNDPTISGSGNFLLQYYKGSGSGMQIRSATYTGGSLTGWYPLSLNAGPLNINIGTGTNTNFGGALISQGTVPTVNTGSCTNVTASGGQVAGKLTLGGACNIAGTIVLSTLPTVTNGYSCDASDLTTPATILRQTASGVATATFTVFTTNSGAADVITYKCIGY